VRSKHPLEPGRDPVRRFLWLAGRPRLLLLFLLVADLAALILLLWCGCRCNQLLLCALLAFLLLTPARLLLLPQKLLPLRLLCLFPPLGV
jgi:hypothetical protein